MQIQSGAAESSWELQQVWLKNQVHHSRCVRKNHQLYSVLSIDLTTHPWSFDVIVCPLCTHYYVLVYCKSTVFQSTCRELWTVFSNCAFFSFDIFISIAGIQTSNPSSCAASTTLPQQQVATPVGCLLEISRGVCRSE